MATVSARYPVMQLGLLSFSSSTVRLPHSAAASFTASDRVAAAAAAGATVVSFQTAVNFENVQTPGWSDAVTNR